MSISVFLLTCLLLAFSPAAASDSIPTTSRRFKIKEGLQLIGDGVNVDLENATPNVRTLHIDKTSQVVVNGVTQPPAFEKLTVRTGAKYTVVLDEEDNAIIVRGGTSRLVPKGKRSVFKDSGILSEDPIYLKKDDKAPPIPHPASTATRLAVNTTSRAPNECNVDDPKREYELAVATDYDFCKEMTSGSMDPAIAEATVRNLVETASLAYEKTTCVVLNPKWIELRCEDPENDPYNVIRGEVGGSVLDAFTELWNSDYTHVHRDVALLLTGLEDGSSTAGVAWNPALCWKEYGYAWVEIKQLVVEVTTHELGHTLGATHTETGVMKSLVNKGNRFFSSDSVATMLYYINSDYGECITAPSPSPSPSATPSQSSTPTPTPTPTPSTSTALSSSPRPSPIPETPANLCSAGYTNKKVSNCRKWKVSYKLSGFSDYVGNVLASSNVYLIYNKFRVTVKAPGRKRYTFYNSKGKKKYSKEEYRVSRLGLLITYDGSVDKQEASEMLSSSGYEFSPNLKKTSAVGQVKEANLEMPDSFKKCCGNSAHIHTFAWFDVKRHNSSGYIEDAMRLYAVKRVRVNCKYCKYGFQENTLDIHKCPLCSS